MTCEAMWSIEYRRFEIKGKPVEIDRGGGVVVFETDNIYGGDMSFYFIGDYKISGGEIIVNGKVKRFNDYLPQLYKDEYTITFRGEYNDDEFMMSGRPDGDEETLIGVQLKKLVDLK